MKTLGVVFLVLAGVIAFYVYMNYSTFGYFLSEDPVAIVIGVGLIISGVILIGKPKK